MQHKVLIFSPFKEIEAILLYPFLEEVKDAFPESQINLICHEDMGSFYTLKDLGINIYEIPSGDYKIALLHRFAVNLHDVFNIDIYFDLSGEFLGAMLGVFFRAKRKIGLHSDLKSKLMFTQSLKNVSSWSVEKKAKRLLQLVDHKKVEEKIYRKISFEKKREKLKFFFVFDNLINCKESLLWVDIANQIYEQNIIFWGGENCENELLSLLNSKSDYHFYENDFDDLKKYLKEVDIVCTNKQWILFACQILGTTCFFFKDKEASFIPSSSFEGPHPVITYDEESILDIIDGEIKKEVRVVDEVLDFIHEKIGI